MCSAAVGEVSGSADGQICAGDQCAAVCHAVRPHHNRTRALQGAAVGECPAHGELVIRIGLLRQQPRAGVVDAVRIHHAAGLCLHTCGRRVGHGGRLNHQRLLGQQYATVGQVGTCAARLVGNVKILCGMDLATVGDGPVGTHPHCALVGRHRARIRNAVTCRQRQVAA